MPRSTSDFAIPSARGPSSSPARATAACPVSGSASRRTSRRRRGASSTTASWRWRTSTPRAPRGCSSWTRTPRAGRSCTTSSWPSPRAGHALTMQGVQMTRPSVYELERELERLEVPTLIMTGDEDEPCLEPALYLKRKIRSSGLAGAAQDRPRHQSRGARRLQPRRARFPHRGGRRPLAAAESPVGVRLGHPSSRSRSPEMTLPLSPYTVIDLTRARSGPTSVRQLADMGARVIQISAREDMEGDFRPPRLRLPEPPPQQAVAHARPQVAARASRSSSVWSPRPTWSSRTSAPTSRRAWASTTRR